MSSSNNLQFFVEIIGAAYIKKNTLGKEISSLEEKAKLNQNNDNQLYAMINEKKNERKRIQAHITKATNDLNAYYSQ